MQLDVNMRGDQKVLQFSMIKCRKILVITNVT